MKTHRPPSYHRGWTALLPMVLAGLACLLPAHAQVIFEDAYNQNFDTLPAPGAAANTALFTYTNNTTLTGWYSNRSGTAVASNGTNNNNGNGLFSWEHSADSDRAFGSYESAGFSPDTAFHGMQLFNNSGSTISDIQLAYTVEQWRRSANATTWVGEYLVTSLAGDQLTAGGYTTITGSSVTATAVGGNSGLNGDLPQFQQDFDLSLNNLGWADGEYLWIRWANSQVADSSGMGLDNLSVTAIPEPAASGSLALCGVLAWLGRRNRRNNRRPLHRSDFMVQTRSSIQ